MNTEIGEINTSILSLLKLREQKPFTATSEEYNLGLNCVLSSELDAVNATSVTPCGPDINSSSIGLSTSTKQLACVIINQQ